MGSNVVVTYKRKRLFSRSDHSRINLHSNTSSEISKSKTSADFDKHERPVEEYTFQNNDSELGTCQYSKDKVEEIVLQRENRESDCCNQCSEMLCSACTEQQHSSVSNDTQKITPEQIRQSPKSDAKQNSFHPNIRLEESFEERCEVNSAGQSDGEEKLDGTRSKLLSMKSGLVCEDKCKVQLSVSPTPDACSRKEPDLISLKTSDGISCRYQMKGTSDLGTFTLEGTDKLNKDQYSGICNNLGIKRKSTSTLITFSRRSKRNGNIAAAPAPNIASESETLPPASCPVDLKNDEVKLMDCDKEKKPPENCDTSCSFSAPAPATAMVMRTDNSLYGEGKNTPTASAQLFQDSCEEIALLQGEVVRPQNLSDENVNSQGSPIDVSGKRDLQLLLDLPFTPKAPCDIDCNQPLDGGSDDYHRFEPSEIHVSPGSTSKSKEKISTLKVHDFMERSVRDKGKFIVDSQPVITGTSSKDNVILIFPENRCNGMLQLANDSEKVCHFCPSSFYGPSLHTEQMMDGNAFCPASYQWPNIQVPFHNFLQSTPDRTQSFSRQKMMLDNILTRARAVRGNRSSFLDKFDHPTTWSEEELDSLWIGVRRHGRGNWEAILRDWKLHFSAWKTPRDLAEKWMDEQSQLFCKPKYVHPTEEVQVQLSLGAGQKQPSLHLLNEMQLQSNISSSSYLTNGYRGLFAPSNESLVNDHPMKGSLPHWLKAAVEVPPSQIDVSSVSQGWVNQPGFNCPQQQAWLDNRYTSAVRRSEPRGKTQPSELSSNKEDELIIIPSDASSEETISDDHNIS